MSKNLGWRQEDVISKPFLNFLHPDDAKGLLQRLKLTKLAKTQFVS